MGELKPVSPAAAAGDPLIALARILSGRSDLEAAPASRAKAAAVNGVALESDLETELLNDLQGSISANYYPPPPAPPPSRPDRPAARPPAETAQPATPAAATVQPAIVEAILPASPPPGETPPSARTEEPAIDIVNIAAVPAAHREAPTDATRALRKSRRDAPSPDPLTEASPPVAGTADPAPIARGLPATAYAHDRPGEAVARAARGRWTRPSQASPAAPEPGRPTRTSRGAGLSWLRPRPPETEEEPFPDLSAFDERGAEEDIAEEEDGPLDLDTLATDQGDDGETTPAAEELWDDEQSLRRRGLLTSAGLLAVVLVGGAAFLLLGSGGPVATPGAPAGKSAAVSPDGPGGENNHVSRLIVGGGPGFDPPAEEGDAAAASLPPAAGTGPDGPPAAGADSPPPSLQSDDPPAGDKPGAGDTDPPPASGADGRTGAANAAGGDAAPEPGGVLVQIAAQKSEEAVKATYHGLQSKFPSILGKFSPNIQRADLGGRGVYYRVRVGPFAFADAQKLCGDLKAAGRDCIIVRR